jgi:hypothetical protein
VVLISVNGQIDFDSDPDSDPDSDLDIAEPLPVRRAE